MADPAKNKSVPFLSYLDKAKGIIMAWETPVLPLNYPRDMVVGREFTTDGGQESPPDGGGMMLVRVEGEAQLSPTPFIL